MSNNRWGGGREDHLQPECGAPQTSRKRVPTSPPLSSLLLLFQYHHTKAEITIAKTPLGRHDMATVASPAPSSPLGPPRASFHRNDSTRASTPTLPNSPRGFDVIAAYRKALEDQRVG